MKKLSFLVFALAATMMMFAQEATAYKVTWVTNGVELPTKPTSNEELWQAFMPAYNAYYGLSRGEQPITAVATFANSLMQDFMTNEKSDWKWLGDYILSVVEAAGFNGGALTSEVLWRFNVQAFFNCKEAASSTWNGNPDFTEAGKYANWIGSWVKANSLPETMTSEDAMPTLEREGYTLVGWYDNAELTGDPVTSVTADVTLYAKWEAVAYKVTWVTNGVEMPVAPTSNEELWQAFMPAYNAYYGLSRGEQPITAVATFANSLMQDFMTNEKSDWKWLGDYILSVVEAAGFNGGALTSEVLWRFNVQAFFNCKEAASSTWNGNPDFTEAGKIENWIGAWKAANLLPETMTIEDPMPVLEKPEYTFLGWYDNEACTGDIVTKVTKDCTLYAGWERAVYNVDFVAPYAYPNNMYVDDVYEMAYTLQEDYNAAYGASKAWAKMVDGQVYYNIAGEWKLPKDAQGQETTVGSFIQASTYNTTDNLKKLVETEGSKWAWVKDAVVAQRTAAGLSTDITEALYRKEISAMFLASPANGSWPGSSAWTNYNGDTIAKAWGGVVALPDTIAEDYTLPAMYRKNYEFKGWYWEKDFSGDAVTVVPVKSNGTLYAKFEPTAYALLGIKLSKEDTVALQMPATDSLYVIYTPDTAANKKVTWSSSDEQVLVVEQNGKVTPKAPGVATVKVVSDESELVATVVYNVKARVGAVTGVTLDKTELTLALGETATLVATVAPEDAVDKSLVWESNGKAVSVDSLGVIKADTVGSATITVTTVDGGYKATCKVTVPEPINADVKVEKLWEVAIPNTVANSNDNCRVGMGYDGIFYITDKTAQAIRVFTKDGEDTEATITLAAADMVGTHDELKITYDTVIVDLDTTITADTTVVPVSTTYTLGTAIALDNAGNIVFGTNFAGNVKSVGIIKKGETKPTIVEFTLPMTGRADQITAFGDIFSKEGGLVAIYPAAATQVQLVKIAEGKLVDVIVLKGTVTAGGNQSQILYATETEAITAPRSGAMQYVKDSVVTTVDLRNYNTADIGGARMIIGGNEVIAYPALIKTGDHTATFYVRNMTAGQFAADKDGNTIHYIIDTKSVGNSSYANLTREQKINDYAYYLNVFTPGKGAAFFKVYQEVAVDTIALDQASATVKAGEKLQLTATVTPSYATVQDVVWSTSDSTIAIVDQNGLVQAIKAGEVTITATTVDGGKVAECALTVKAVYYHRAMSVDELTAGKKMLIVNAGDTLAMAEARTNNFGQVAIAPVEGVLSDVPAEATIITIEKDSVFAFAVEGGYLTATTAKSNYLRVAEERGTLTEWDITISAEGLATIICHDVESERNTIRYNKGSNIFSAYKTGTQEDVVIYVEYEKPSYEVYEEEITNLVIDYDNMLLIGGPSEEFQVEVMLGLGDYNRNDDTYQLLPASTISVRGSEATFIDGVASVDGFAQTATAIVHCTWNGMALEFHLTMSAAPLEATKVVVENAAIEIEKVLLFGDMYDYALKMTGVWKDSTGVEYPVLVEVPVYYPEATEPYEMYSTVTVGGKGDDDPWLGFGEGYLTITPEGEKVTATGVVENPMAGIAIDITISGNLPGTAVDNIPVTVKAVKVVKNGQLVIIKGDVEYNAQGAVIK